MYYSHFGLTQAPFKITPNTDFFFSGSNRGPVLEALIYAVTHGEGIIKVTGEVGSGKTMLCNMLQTRLPANIETVYLANPSVSPEEILHAIAFELQLGLPRTASRLEVMHALQEFLLKRYAEGKRVVVFVEESQGMPLATLEEIRLLSNLETHNDKLLQIVLFGQPELDMHLREPGIRQLRERITHSFRLEPLRTAEVREYLMFRLRTAGYHGPDLFTASVVKAIARASAGLTRRINIIADKALLAAFSENTHTVKLKHVEEAVRDSEFSQEEEPHRAAPRWGWGTALVALGAVAGAAAYAVMSETDRLSPQRARPVAATPAPVGAGSAEPATATGPAEVVPEAPKAKPPVDKTIGYVEKSTAEPVVAAVATPSQAASTPAAAKAERPSVAGIAPAKPSPSDRVAVETPPVTKPESADPLTRRLEATREWLAQEQSDTYSIQLMGTGDEEQLRHRLNDIAKFVDLNEIFVYRTVAKGKPFLTVLYGAFKERGPAREALARLPDFLTAYRPILRTVGGIRAELSERTSS